MKRAVKRGILILTALIAVTAAVFAGLVLRDRAARERLLREYPVAYVDTIAHYADEYDLDPFLVLAVMRAESSFKSDAVSSAGAVGLMQIMPDTGAWIAHKLDMDDVYEESMLFEPDYSVRFGCWLPDGSF